MANGQNQNSLQPDAPERNLATRGLRVKAPKPNIIRIETLDGEARQRYLGQLQRFADKQIKKATYDKVVPASDSIFYGFVKNAGNQPITLNTNWSDTGGSGGLLGGVKGLIDKAASGGGFAGAAASIVSGGVEAVQGLESAAKTLTGIDANLTGSSSLKQVSSIGISGFSVDCGWYLPEQLNLATSSLKILFRMAYPRQIADRVFQQVTGDLARGAGNAVTNSVVDALGKTGMDNAAYTKDIAKTTTDGFANLTEGATALYNDFNSLVGRNLTLDPLPVRVSMGHYLDVEPMVITNVSVNFSKEQWVAPNKRHLPIFLTVSVTFDMWLNPAPKLEFMQFLGTEMFGLDPYQKSVERNLLEKDSRNEQRLADKLKEQQENKSDAEDESTWYNPFSWGD